MTKSVSSNRRLIGWIAGGVGVAALLVMAFRPRAVSVDIAEVAKRPLQVTVGHEGQTRVHDRYMVSAPVAGRVQRVALRPGDAVIGGQTVVATFLPSAPPLLDVRTRAEA